ncbi:hypothetical protein LWI28_013969 [Acer negundo]|uniref:non-specific serine/threonine protein kinase n=1 Tax=Acer negundo TaxID=4023 RepID=A0AAD5IQB8_ACENE|nr:hypothetical protein LWI28_013969 [Acer negundo]
MAKPTRRVPSGPNSVTSMESPSVALIAKPRNRVPFGPKPATSPESPPATLIVKPTRRVPSGPNPTTNLESSPTALITKPMRRVPSGPNPVDNKRTCKQVLLLAYQSFAAVLSSINGLQVKLENMHSGECISMEVENFSLFVYMPASYRLMKLYSCQVITGKDLVKKMMCADPKERLSAVEVIIRGWCDASDKPLDIAVLTRMKQFREMNKLKKVALKVIAENLSGLKEMFKSMDTDSSGTITYEELKARIPNLGTRLSESEIRQNPTRTFLLSLSHRDDHRHTPHAVGRALGRPMEDVRSTYIFARELGRGQFGVTYLVTHKETKQQFACKSIATRKLIDRDAIEDVRREVQIMHHLIGHRNIVELKEAYEDRHSVNLIMELCAGGELFDRIIAKGHYSERAAANLCRQMVTVVHYCHSMGVMHRDLKPENFLLLSADEDWPLKATDFGLSVFFKPGEVFRDLVGSTYYVAPEVLRRSYGAEADIWSAGVILYLLLSGVPPLNILTRTGAGTLRWKSWNMPLRSIISAMRKR